MYLPKPSILGNRIHGFKVKLNFFTKIKGFGNSRLFYIANCVNYKFSDNLLVNPHFNP